MRDKVNKSDMISSKDLIEWIIKEKVTVDWRVVISKGERWTYVALNIMTEPTVSSGKAIESEDTTRARCVPEEKANDDERPSSRIRFNGALGNNNMTSEACRFIKVM